MGTPVPVISGREAAKGFERLGWTLLRQRGSHMIFGKPAAWDRYRIYLHKAYQVTTLHLNDHSAMVCGKNPIHVADRLRALRESKKIHTLKQLARTCGMLLEQVNRYLKLHDLNRSIQARIRGLGEMIGRQRITEPDLRPIARMRMVEAQSAAFTRLLRSKGSTAIR